MSDVMKFIRELIANPEKDNEGKPIPVTGILTHVVKHERKSEEAPSMYSVEGLEHGIERCKVNIASLETAIDAERKTIADYRIMIDSLEKAEQKQKEANAHVEFAPSDNKN